MLIAASITALAGCVPFIPGGPTTSEDREIEAVTTVELDTSGDLTISEGEPSLVIRASRGALERLTSEIDGDSLVLGSAPGPGFGMGEVDYDLTLPDLETVELNGSGDIGWEGIDGESVVIRISGSGDVDLSGTATALTVELDGSGDIDAEDLRTQDAVVAIDGSGNVDVTVRDTLRVEISGSGRVAYSGDPSVDSDISGSGDVVRE